MRWYKDEVIIVIYIEGRQWRVSKIQNTYHKKEKHLEHFTGQLPLTNHISPYHPCSTRAFVLAFTHMYVRYSELMGMNCQHVALHLTVKYSYTFLSTDTTTLSHEGLAMLTSNLPIPQAVAKTVMIPANMVSGFR